MPWRRLIGKQNIFIGKNIFHEKYFKTFLKAKKHSPSFAIFYFFFRQQMAYFFQKLFSFCSFFSFLSNLILFSGGQVWIQKYFFNKLTIVFFFNVKLRKTQNSLLQFKALKSDYENFNHFFKAFFFLAWEKYFYEDLHVRSPQHFLRNILSFSEAWVSEN